ncbi:MAG: DNA glycosylase [Clostridiales bacterium]|nr:DNA glycosylase [Clostridiales bacterium]
MNVNIAENDIILTNTADFNLRHIFDCGQCFRFNQIDDNTYEGVAYNRALKISQSGDTVTLYSTPEEDFYNIWYRFFDLDTDYGQIKRRICTDEYMREATDYGRGIRILKQELWETIISFIISASNNIPRIKGIVERLCENFGNKFEYMGKIYYGFPSAQVLARLSLEELSPIRAGFRDKYILDAAKKVSEGTLSLQALDQMPTADAKSTLMSVKGIGEKVANCILLFGMGRCEAFPVDVWIKRIMEHCYFDCEQPKSSIARLADEKFSDLGGYAQQYLFFWARDNHIGI